MTVQYKLTNPDLSSARTGRPFRAGMRHFLDLDLIPPAELRRILDAARKMKAARYEACEADAGHNGDAAADTGGQLCAGRTLTMIFDKPSTRTRVSFDIAMRQLGGSSLVLNKGDMQLGRGETIADTAKVLSRYTDILMIRTGPHKNLLELATHARIPVINGLTDYSHPCQIMADILTFEEHRGPIKDKVIAWSGDGNNVAISWIHAAAAFGFELRLATPEALRPDKTVVNAARRAGARIKLTKDPALAVKNADCVVADTWVSMGDEDADQRIELLTPYRVDEALMAKARDNAIFMHCLPAHRGEEVTANVIDGPHSVVFDEAENRLHAQKAILAWCLNVL